MLPHRLLAATLTHRLECALQPHCPAERAAPNASPRMRRPDVPSRIVVPDAAPRRVVSHRRDARSRARFSATSFACALSYAAAPNALPGAPLMRLRLGYAFPSRRLEGVLPRRRRSGCPFPSRRSEDTLSDTLPSVAPSICWQESDVSVSAGPFSSLDGKKSSFLYGETLSSDAGIPISCQFGV